MSHRSIPALIIILFLIGCQPKQKERMMDEKSFFKQVPSWAAKVVWYQIFPDRFENGDPGNDPDRESLRGAWPHDAESPWNLSPWTADWYKLQPWEKENGKDIWFNIQRRRYGGDLQGIINKLDYLEDLGIGAIYLNPVFQAPSLHKYDGACYHHIDVHFGPDPKGDLQRMAKENPVDPSTWIWTEADQLVLKLIKEAHRRNIRIIFDGVFNHMGITSFAFQDLLKNGKKSEFRDWFTVTDWKTPGFLGAPFTYEGWFGVAELPELREDEKGIVEGPRQYIFDATRRWMDPDGDGDPSDGIDGWRLDVAFCVGHPFWKAWRSHVKAINPEAYLTAEIIDSPEKVLPYLEGDEFDAVMNYNFAFIAHKYFVNRQDKITPVRFARGLDSLLNIYPLETLYVMQNLYDSHDTQRLLSALANPDIGKFENWGEFFGKSQAHNPHYNIRPPEDEETLKIHRQMIVLQMTFVGAPMIYYGDEAGMWGANDPCCRKPMVWPGRAYEAESTRPNQTPMSPVPVAFNHDLHDFYRKLIHFRNEHPALQTGDYGVVVADNDNGLFGFRRQSGPDVIMVLFNSSDRNQPFSIHENHFHDKKKITDYLSNTEYSRTDHEFIVDIPAKKAIILY
ncbi:MAG: alpha-amylase family glycosyl hydrolase [Fidelibacterota bacterium]